MSVSLILRIFCVILVKLFLELGSRSRLITPLVTVPLIAVTDCYKFLICKQMLSRKRVQKFDEKAFTVKSICNVSLLITRNMAFYQISEGNGVFTLAWSGTGTGTGKMCPVMNTSVLPCPCSGAV